MTTPSTCGVPAAAGGRTRATGSATRSLPAHLWPWPACRSLSCRRTVRWALPNVTSGPAGTRFNHSACRFPTMLFDLVRQASLLPSWLTSWPATTNLGDAAPAYSPDLAHPVAKMVQICPGKPAAPLGSSPACTFVRRWSVAGGLQHEPVLTSLPHLGTARDPRCMPG